MATHVTNSKLELAHKMCATLIYIFGSISAFKNYTK
jgi:hypothetical protein